jgi:ATP-dependent exoDNAse (exonuclease V) beta subunit
VLLSPYKPENSKLFLLTQEKAFEGLQLESIMKFKGLEAPIVLLCDLGLNKFAKRPELLFTGASRARQLLFVFCHEGYPTDNHH